MCIQRVMVTNTVTLAADEERTVFVDAPTNSGLSCIGGGWVQGGDNVHVFSFIPRAAAQGVSPERCEFRLKNTAASSVSIDLRAIFTVVV